MLPISFHPRGFAGNFLFSTGPNTQGGGTRVTKGHYDLPMKDCTVYLDNEMIIDHQFATRANIDRLTRYKWTRHTEKR